MIFLKRILFSILAFPLFANAMIVGPITLRGKLKSVGPQNIVVVTKSTKYIIPRKFVPKQKFVSGKTISVSLSGDQYKKIRSLKIK